MRSRNETVHSVHTRIYLLIAICILAYVLYKGIQQFSASLFVSRPDRINMVMYGPQTHYYSLDAEDKQHYLINFHPDLKVDVPGGYGNYRVGSLGKLALLDKNPDLLKKTFATTTSTFIHYYFYPGTEAVYYGNTMEEERKKPSLQALFLHESNAGFLDRLYLAVNLLDEKDENFYALRYQEEKNNVLGDVVFKNDTFIKESIGLLYQNTYRDEQQSIQILYPNKYATAQRISALLEGNGIRVSDISPDVTASSSCLLIVSDTSPSQTATDISHYFNCPIKTGKTDVYDMIFILGTLEKEWEIL